MNIMSSDRISEVGVHEQTDLVELRTVHYTYGSAIKYGCSYFLFTFSLCMFSHGFFGALTHVR